MDSQALKQQLSALEASLRRMLHSTTEDKAPDFGIKSPLSALASPDSSNSAPSPGHADPLLPPPPPPPPSHANSTASAQLLQYTQQHAGTKSRGRSPIMSHATNSLTRAGAPLQPRAPRNTCSSANASIAGQDIAQLLHTVARTLATASAAATPRTSLVGAHSLLSQASERFAGELLRGLRPSAAQSQKSNAALTVGEDDTRDHPKNHQAARQVDASEVTAALLHLADVTPANTRRTTAQVQTIFAVL